MMSLCYHCGLEITGNANDYSARSEGNVISFCCRGCMTVWRLISKKGLSEFYRYRDKDKLYPQQNKTIDYLKYDNPVAAKRFVKTNKGISSANLFVEGIVCSACSWLIENIVKKMDGVINVTVNFSSHRLHIAWDQQKIRLSDILSCMAEYGYKSYPYEQSRVEEYLKKTNEDLLKRLAFAGFAAGNVMFLSICLYAGKFSGIEYKFKTFFEWVSMILATPAICYSAYPMILSALRSLKAGKANMDVPISIGILVTYFFSAYSLFYGYEPYFDSLCVFIFIILIGKYIQSRIKGDNISAIDNLKRLKLKVARVVKKDKTCITKEISDVKKGDLIKVIKGESIPLDGNIVSTSGISMDESMLTGEPHAVSKGIGDVVTGGTTIIEGELLYTVTHVDGDGSLDKIIELSSKDNSNSSKIISLSDTIALYFVISILLISAGSFVYWFIAGANNPLLIAVSVLIITCPCAFSLSIPIALISANRVAQSIGAIIKSGDILERLSVMTHLVLDKTGTITTGAPEIEEIVTFNGLSKDQFFQYLVPLESCSQHPLAVSILKSIKKMPDNKADEVRIFYGMGMQGTVDNKKVLVGNEKFFSTNNISLQGYKKTHDKNKTTIYCSIDGTISGKISFMDQTKKGLSGLSDYMESRGIKISLATGDSEIPARKATNSIKLDKLLYGALPRDKMEFIERLAGDKEITVMVGDGFNDAPALSKADVSIAYRSLSNIPMTVADIVLINSDVSSLRYLHMLSQVTMKVIRQNIAISILYNLIAVPLAVTGNVSPIIAAFLMPLSSIFVLLNARRINKWK